MHARIAFFWTRVHFFIDVVKPSFRAQALKGFWILATAFFCAGVKVYFAITDPSFYESSSAASPWGLDARCHAP
jgi:hypothetical protein